MELSCSWCHDLLTLYPVATGLRSEIESSERFVMLTVKSSCLSVVTTSKVRFARDTSKQDENSVF